MATTRNQISYGSRGDEVKELQTALVKNGYNLSVDGIFGSKTQAAVKDYQTKNKLQVDGIVGKNTWGSLFPTTTPTTTPTNTQTSNGAVGGAASSALKDKNTSSNSTTKPKSAAQTALESFAYKESDVVAQAKAALQAQLNNKPDAYQSTYQQQIDDVLNKILNREKFSYDLNGDALYQQYKDQYTTQGKQAMMDTMGQAAALTGGYGNSYAQSVGQQTYQGYLQQLNDKVPELYQLAMDKYRMEGDDLLNQYSLYTDRENTEYGRYRDDVSDYYTNLDFAYNQYNNERDFDYGQHRDGVSDKMWQTQYDESLRQYAEQMAYQKERDKVADQQWQATFDESARQFNVAKGISAGGSGGSGGSGGNGGSGGSGSGGGGGKTYDTHGYTKEQIKALQKAAGIKVDGIWGKNTQAAYEAGYRPDSTPKAAAYNAGELVDAAAAGMTKAQIEETLKKRGVDTSKASVQADIRWALSK